MPTLHILGAGTPSPMPERWGTAFALEVGEDVVMIDCGPAATLKLVRAGFRPTDVEWLFFTHHHSDHTVDLPALLLTRWDHCTGGEPPLRIVGPPPTMEMAEKLFGPEGAFADDIRARSEHPASHRCHTDRGGSLPRPEPEPEAYQAGPGLTVEAVEWTATCAEVEHVDPWLTSLAWRFDWERGSVCFTGDTSSHAPVVELAADVGTLVANVPLRQERLHPDLATCIYGTLDAAQVARDAGVDRLVLVHLTQSLVNERDEALAEMAQVYDGEVILGEELMPIDL